VSDDLATAYARVQALLDAEQPADAIAFAEACTGPAVLVYQILALAYALPRTLAPVRVWVPVSHRTDGVLPEPSLEPPAWWRGRESPRGPRTEDEWYLPRGR
jgi:hypothetical protein